MPNIELQPYLRPSMWRKMSFANWRASRDPQVYGRLEIDMSRAMEYAHKLSEASGTKITPTHIIVRAVALALRANPDTNVIIRLNRTYRRKDVDVFCQVAIPGEKPDLSGTTIRRADTKGAVEIARELKERARKVREGKDKELARTRSQLNLMPVTFARFALWVVGMLTYTFNLNMKFIGLPRDPFGSVMVTSVGSLGISEAYPPLVPMSRVPLLVCIGRLEDKPVVRDGNVVVRPVCVLTATFDHRVMDGCTAGKMAAAVVDYLADPEKFEEDE